MIKNLLVILILIYSSFSWSVEPTEKVNACAAKIEGDYLEALNSHKLSGTLSGQKLCQLVEAKFSALAHCQNTSLEVNSRNQRAISFAHFLSKTEAMSTEEGESEIQKLKAKWKSSSFLEQRKIQMRIQQIRTCYFPQNPGAGEQVLQNASR